MGTQKKMLLAGLLRFGSTIASRLLSRPTVQSTVRGLVRKLVTGTRERPHCEIPSVERTSDRIVEILQGQIPTSACLGIDGIAGSGKSTLGRSLSKKLDLKWRTLYAREMDKPVELKGGTIYENIRLLRTQDINHFHAIFYIDIPIEKARARVLERDRDGALADILDFKKLKHIGDVAFEVAAGEEIRIPDSPVRMKIRPNGGYRSVENLISRLKAARLQEENLSKEEMIFLHCYGEAKKGIRPYLKLGAYNREILAGLLAGLLVAFDKIS
jgi:hypothetical protein